MVCVARATCSLSSNTLRHFTCPSNRRFRKPRLVPVEPPTPDFTALNATNNGAGTPDSHRSTLGSTNPFGLPPAGHLPTP